MPEFTDLLRHNRNYRYTWLGQVVSETGDYFNNIAVFSLVMAVTGSGLVVSGVMLSRAIPALLAGPVAGVALDFIATVRHPSAWLLYALSGLLMFVSPFFTSGRAAILPAIASPAELHTANSLTQTTQWATLTAGTMLAGFAVARLGFAWAFALNSLSFIFSAYAVWQLRAPGGFVAERGRTRAAGMLRPWREYVE